MWKLQGEVKLKYYFLFTFLIIHFIFSLCKEKNKDIASSKDMTDYEKEGVDNDMDDNYEADSASNVPKIVSAGLGSLFEIISDTRSEHPKLCTKALKALHDIIQSQDPESFKNEPEKLFNALYDMLLELTTLGQSGSNQKDVNWSSLSCSTLLALCVARGDTGKLLKAITSIFMSSKILSGQIIQLPHSVVKLQRSVHSVALGRLNTPDYFSHGIVHDSLVDHFNIKDYMFVDKIYSPNCIASDGKFIYILISKSLVKIGSGYNGTSKGFIYGIAKDFGKDKNEWIGYCNNKLFYKKLSKRNIDNLLVVDTDTLAITGSIQTQTSISMKDGNNCLLFSDGDSICCLCSTKDAVSRNLII